MAYTVKITNAFETDLNKILKKFKKSANDIAKFISNLANEPVQGDRFPGHGENHVQKVRIELGKYRIGKSGGLRLIYLVKEIETTIIPIYVYSKAKYKKESDVLKAVKKRLRDILKELKEEKEAEKQPVE